jgi:uncharacterized protein (TIGR00299 family) protein
MPARRHIHLDPVGGVAGDMFIAAILDGFPELEAGAVDAMRLAGLPETWQVTRQADRRKGLAGSRLIFKMAQGAQRDSGSKSYTEIRQMIAESDLTQPVRVRALAILDILGAAEAKVHGVDIDSVHFHELAGWDSLADVVAAAWLITELKASSWSCAPLPVGRGTVMTAHGPLPLPAPATVEILKDLPVRDDNVAGEQVTPTGAAIVKSLEPEMASMGGGMRLAASGTGLGKSDFPEVANCVRVLVFEAVDDSAVMRDEVGVVEFFVDDQTPEDLAIAVANMLARDEVLDLHQVAAVGRKGRLGHALTVICRRESLEDTAAACLDQFATIGLRLGPSERRVLAREEAGAVKSVRRPGGGVTKKLAADDVSADGGDYAARAALRRQFEDDRS